MINITAVIKVHAHFDEKYLLEHFRPLVHLSRLEPGCHNYELHKVIGEQGSYLMLERWESQQDIDRHNRSDHFLNFLKSAGDLLAAPLKILITEKIL